MKKLFKMIIFFTSIILLVFVGCFFIGSPPRAEKITWGVNFSQKHSQNLGLDWKENYLALLEDLNIKNLKVLTHWDLLEPKDGEYYFDDLDWQLAKAEEKGAKILLVIGMKTGRWPECHIPDWSKNFIKKNQQEKILNLIEKIVLRYQDSTSIEGWQVENEPLFSFGECPWVDKKFLKKEIDLVKTLDKRKKPVIISDSGEGSFWLHAARLGDIVGTTMYKRVWFKELGFYVSYPFPPTFYWRKAKYIEKIFNKKVMVAELQAEPWGPKLLYDLPLEEQKKTMDLEQFRKNIDFAKRTGLDTFYLWGGEWWYWMRVKQNDFSIWNEAKKLWQ